MIKNNNHGVEIDFKSYSIYIIKKKKKIDKQVW